MFYTKKLTGTLLACMATLFAASTANAAAVTDAVGDFIPEYTGPERPDIDVIGIDVSQDATSFWLVGKMAGAILPASGASYVWGVNRGAGTARFGVNYNGILFDTVIVAQAAGTATYNLFDGGGNKALDPSVLTIAGDTVTLKIAKSLLPSTGFSFADYGFNLWPRAAATGGIANLSDFAPDNATVKAPEPASLTLAGLAIIGLAMSRKRNRIAP